jgi:hypothetical protein
MKFEEKNNYMDIWREERGFGKFYKRIFPILIIFELLSIIFFIYFLHYFKSNEVVTATCAVPFLFIGLIVVSYICNHNTLYENCYSILLSEEQTRVKQITINAFKNDIRNILQLKKIEYIETTKDGNLRIFQIPQLGIMIGYMKWKYNWDLIDAISLFDNTGNNRQLLIEIKSLLSAKYKLDN